MKRNVAANILIALLVFTQGIMRVQAQSEGVWAVPANLSNSGSTSNPTMVIDSEGTYHVVWNDEFAGINYVSGDGIDWTTPLKIELPTNDIVPVLLADKNGRIHAFWRNIDEALLYSSISAGDFALSAWNAPIQLAEAVLDYDVVLDSIGDIHMSYIRPLESVDFPAGVYYSRLSNGSADWSAKTLLYSSPYLRALELSDSNIDIATRTRNNIINAFVVWDNRPQGRVYLANSSDGGQSWSVPDEVDKPEAISGSSNPFNIHVGADDQNVLLIWQRGQSSVSCSQYYQWSADGSNEWTEPQPMLEKTQGCAQETQLITNESGPILFWASIQDQINLLAWDGKQWSRPQIQYELSTLINPETYELVFFESKQPHLIGEDELVVVGSDTGGGGDIWFTSRRLNNLVDWYPSESGWSDPADLVSSEFELQSPVLIAGPSELLHVLWSRVDEASGSANRTVIYYNGGDVEQWSQPVPVIQSPTGSASQPSATIDADNRLLVVWSAIEEGKLFFNWANSARANIVTEWSEPIQLPIGSSIARSPDILVNRNGVIYVAYAVPINEGRGIYLTRSVDGGETWSPPVQVFDAVSAGWQMVDQPQLAQTPDGTIHALWIHRPLLDSGGTLGLFYARSEDDGETWSTSEVVVDGSVMWRQITAGDDGTTYRMWQEEVLGQPVIRFQRSVDRGLTWSLTDSLASFGENLRIAKLVLDQGGNLHLLQIVKDSSGRLILRHWLWEDEHWLVSENFELAYGPTLDVSAMAATSSPSGELDLVYSTKKGLEQTDAFLYSVLFTNRSSELPIEIPPQPTSIPVPTNTNTPSPTATAYQTVTAIPTSTPDLIFSNPTETSRPVNRSSNGLLVGVILSGLIVVTVFGIGIWRVRSNH